MISVIMPSLNVVRYIEQSILSVVKQTCFPELEVLIVDAGSTDGTREIAAQCADQYDNVHLIDCPIRSYGYQVNLAVNQARGDYIAILDTDDYVGPDAYEMLYKIAYEGDYDFVKGGKVCFYQDSILGEKETNLFSKKNIENYFNRELDVEKYPELFSVDWNIWNGIYRASIFKEIRLSETRGAAFQDIGGLFRLLYRSKRGFLTDRLVYHYRVDNENASSYSPNVLHYALHEYGSLIEEYVNAKSWWKESVYCRFAAHAIGLVRQAAKRGINFGDIRDDVEKICEMLSGGIEEYLITESNFADDWDALQMLLTDAEGCFRKALSDCQIGNDALKEIVIISRRNHVVIFGCGVYGRYVADTVRKDHVRVKQSGNAVYDILFVDNDQSKHGLVVDDISVAGIQEAMNRFPQARYVIAVKYHEEEIYKQLLDAGVDAERISTYSSFTEWVIPEVDL